MTEAEKLLKQFKNAKIVTIDDCESFPKTKLPTNLQLFLKSIIISVILFSSIPIWLNLVLLISVFGLLKLEQKYKLDPLYALLTTISSVMFFKMRVERGNWFPFAMMWILGIAKARLEFALISLLVTLTVYRFFLV